MLKSKEQSCYCYRNRFISCNLYNNNTLPERMDDLIQMLKEKTGYEFGHQTADQSVDRTGRMTELIEFGFGHPSRSVNSPRFNKFESTLCRPHGEEDRAPNLLTIQDLRAIKFRVSFIITRFVILLDKRSIGTRADRGLTFTRFVIVESVNWLSVCPCEFSVNGYLSCM